MTSHAVSEATGTSPGNISIPEGHNIASGRKLALFGIVYNPENERHTHW